MNRKLTLSWKILLVPIFFPHENTFMENTSSEFKNFNFHAKKFIVNRTHTHTGENNLSFFHFSFLNITHSIFPKLEQSLRDGKITSESDLNYQ